MFKKTTLFKPFKFAEYLPVVVWLRDMLAIVDASIHVVYCACRDKLEQRCWWSHRDTNHVTSSRQSKSQANVQKKLYFHPVQHMAEQGWPTSCRSLQPAEQRVHYWAERML